MKKQIVFPVIKENNNPIEFIVLGYYLNREDAEKVAEEKAKTCEFGDIYPGDECSAVIDNGDVYTLTDKVYHGTPAKTMTKRIVFCAMYETHSGYEFSKIIDNIYEDRGAAEEFCESELEDDPDVDEGERHDTDIYVEDKMAIIDGTDVYVYVGKLQGATK